MSEKEKKILNVARYIIENKATIKVTADHFKMSISSIKKYINDPNNLKSIDIDLYNEVKLIQDELINIGKYVGGKNGQRGPKYTEFEALEIAEVMISESLTLKEAEEYFGIPSSTIYERIRSIDDEDLQSDLNYLFKENVEASRFSK